MPGDSTLLHRGLIVAKMKVGSIAHDPRWCRLHEYICPSFSDLGLMQALISWICADSEAKAPVLTAHLAQRDPPTIFRAECRSGSGGRHEQPRSHLAFSRSISRRFSGGSRERLPPTFRRRDSGRSSVMRDSYGDCAEHRARDEPHLFSNTTFPLFSVAVM